MVVFHIILCNLKSYKQYLASEERQHKKNRQDTSTSPKHTQITSLCVKASQYEVRSSQFDLDFNDSILLVHDH